MKERRPLCRTALSSGLSALPRAAAGVAAKGPPVGAGIGDGHDRPALPARKSATYLFRRFFFSMLPVEALAPAGAEPTPFVAWIGHHHELPAARAEEAPQDGRAFRPGPVFAGLFPVRFFPAQRRAVPLGASVREEALPAHRADRFPLHGAPAGLYGKSALLRARYGLLHTGRNQSCRCYTPPVRKSDGRSMAALFAQRVLQFTVSTSFVEKSVPKRTVSYISYGCGNYNRKRPPRSTGRRMYGKILPPLSARLYHVPPPPCQLEA